MAFDGIVVANLVHELKEQLKLIKGAKKESVE